MGIINKAFTCWAVTFLLILSAGCSYIAPGKSKKDLVPISSIGILPAQTSSHLPSKSPTMAELETGAETINSLLENYFQGYTNVSLISQSKLEGLPSAKSGKYLSLAREAGQHLQYDAVLVTSVERYQDRKGSEYSVKDPASVAFSLKLLAVVSGEVIWSADFDQTQQPLLENILPKSRSTGSGFHWLTAAELTSAGLTKKLNSCPYLKRD
ncbi:hypothetical protein ACFLZ5_09655 [Thermodesulfobacteriota bacterium]